MNREDARLLRAFMSGCAGMPVGTALVSRRPAREGWRVGVWSPNAALIGADSRAGAA